MASMTLKSFAYEVMVDRVGGASLAAGASEDGGTTQQVGHESTADSSCKARQPHQLKHGGAPGEVHVHSGCGNGPAGAAAKAQEG